MTPIKLSMEWSHQPMHESNWLMDKSQTPNGDFSQSTLNRLKQITSVIPTMKPETLRMINYYSSKFTHKVDNFLTKSRRPSFGETSTGLTAKSISTLSKFNSIGFNNKQSFQPSAQGNTETPVPEAYQNSKELLEDPMNHSSVSFMDQFILEQGKEMEKDQMHLQILKKEL